MYYKPYASIKNFILTIFILIFVLAILPRYAEASTKTMYVLTSISNNDNNIDSYYPPTYSYYSNGLLKSEKSEGTKTYSYNNKHNVKSINDHYAGSTYAHKYTYKKGRLSNSRRTMSWCTYYCNYSYGKSGQLKTIISKPDDNGSNTTTQYTYDKKGRVSSCNITTAGRSTEKYYNIKYDSKGNIKSYTYSPSYYTENVKHTNTYKNGRLIKSSTKVKTNNGAWTKLGTTFYNYKKVQVPSSLVKKVKAQQRVLTNSVPFALDIAICTALA